MKTFSVSAVTRAGIRFFCTEVSGWNDEDLALSAGLSQESIAALIGTPTQVGMIVSGRTPDAVGYTINFSSVTEMDIARVYGNLILSAEQRAAFLKNRVIFDIDLYETHFSFVEHTLVRWSRTKIDKAAEFMSKFRAYIQEKGED